MAFSNVNILSTRESVFGAKRLGQILAVPSGRMDKASLYLEPIVADASTAAMIDVIVEVYDIDTIGNPIGSALASDSKPLSDITIRGFQNFRLEAFVPTVVAVIVRLVGADANNHVAWRYANVSSGGEELLISTDGGASWAADPTRKFAYRTFSIVSDAIDIDQQTATIKAGTLNAPVDIGAQFSLGTLERTAVTGDTLAIDFGDFVITAVIDQSGSMTWNDRDGLRYEFIKDFLADIDASLPSTSTATYSLIKFRGRKIGNMTISVQGSENLGLHLDGIRVVRKAGSPPTGITDGLIVFEGLAQEFIDDGSVSPLALGTTYYYAAFAFATFGTTTLYSTQMTDVVVLAVPAKAPVGVAGFTANPQITDSGGTPLDLTLVPPPTDYGYRRVSLSWLNPQNYNYSTITLVRRADRPPESPIDGTVLLSGVSPTTVSYIDTFSGAYQPVTELTYYYRIFTANSIGIQCLAPNAMIAAAEIQPVPRPWEQLEPPANPPPFGFDDTPPGTPAISAVASNGEIQLTWIPADADSKRFKLFYNETKFPTPTNDKGTEYDGTLLYDGTGTSFTHRFLLNGQPHFYVLIALDQVGNASSPASPLIGGKPPKPDADATTFFSPEPVSALTAEVINATSIRIDWTNPTAPESLLNSFYFGDQVKVIANVQFVDSGTSESFLTFEFIEGERTVVPFDEKNSVDKNIALHVARAPSNISQTISAIVSVNPLLDLQNKMNSASIRIAAALRVKNMATGTIVAEAKTQEITLKFSNPFALAVKNEPEQVVSTRQWIDSPNNVEGTPCKEKQYSFLDVSGVYVNSGDPFFALLEAGYRGLPLGGPLGVKVELLDKATQLPTTLVKINGASTQNIAALEINDVSDEVVDRSGEPTGETRTRSLLPLTLPPSTIPGNLTMKATASFRGYTRVATLDIHYEPVLNVDLTLTPFQTDNVDRTEQNAFVYLAPFDAPQDQKIPVPDFTVTDWSIKPLCSPAKLRPLVSEDSVPGLGVKSYTRGGLARRIFWGPGEDVLDEQLYEVHVKVQASGQAGEGFGMVALGPPSGLSSNKIFLRNANLNNFYIEEIYSDGESISTWDVIAKPEDDAGRGPNDITSGQSFRAAVLNAGGLVPSLEDGRIITMVPKIINAADPEGTPPTQTELAAIISSIRIKTNLTGANGKAGTVKAKVANGKATFQISVNAAVPKKKETISVEELEDNFFYSLYGLQFEKPQSGLYLALSVYTSIEVNGKSISFYGGGENLVLSAPPAFVQLKEPLKLT